jgi:hypothetical protein
VGGVLVGGYSGTWLAAEIAATVPLQPSGLAAVGGIVGAGVIAVVPEDACGWTETANVLRWLAGQTAGQCGPACTASQRSPELPNRCVTGRGGDATFGRLNRWAADVRGRGACALPDGAVRFLQSALEVFGADVRAHLHGRRCAGSREPRILPVPEPREGGIDASAPRPDRVHRPRDLRGTAPRDDQARRLGYPILADATVPAELLPMARRTLNACPALALRLEREPKAPRG